MAQAALTNNIITIFRLTEHTAAAAREPQLCPRASALHPLAQPAAPPALSQQRRLYFFGALQGEQRSPALRELVPGEIVINGPESRRFRFPAREPARPTREGSGADRPGAAQPASGRARSRGRVPRVRRFAFFVMCLRSPLFDLVGGSLRLHLQYRRCRFTVTTYVLADSARQRLARPPHEHSPVTQHDMRYMRRSCELRDAPCTRSRIHDTR